MMVVTLITLEGTSELRKINEVMVVMKSTMVPTTSCRVITIIRVIKLIRVLGLLGLLGLIGLLDLFRL
jgi:hypothetical protein